MKPKNPIAKSLRHPECPMKPKIVPKKNKRLEAAKEKAKEVADYE